VSGARYDCAGEITLRGDASTIEELTIGGKPLRQLRLNQGSVTLGGQRARTASGDAIERVTLSRSGAGSTVTVVEISHRRGRRSQADWPEPFSAALRARSASSRLLVLRDRPPATARGHRAAAPAAEAKVRSALRAAIARGRTPPNSRAMASRSARALRSAPRFPAAAGRRASAPKVRCLWRVAPGLHDQSQPVGDRCYASVAASLRAETGRTGGAAMLRATTRTCVRACRPKLKRGRNDHDLFAPPRNRLLTQLYRRNGS
jgi:hypothetical protein